MQYDSLHTLLYQLNQNVLSLSRATDAIGDWIGNTGSTSTSTKISEHLDMVERNSEAIANAMADLAISRTPLAK
ncbi:hypothetical protein ABH905_005215 [Pseudomonas frederiksbergensis]|uniref:hypothetical protein n=1 Tax=Pseudomonas frederiksbergensis TaxID=104087 RepID=UPI003D20281B